MERKTIRRWLRSGHFPERKPPYRRPPKVNHFAEYLQQRWDEGCHNAAQLYREIRENGYLGKRAMVARLVATWRKGGKISRPNAPERISPKHTATLVTRAVDQMTEVQQRLFDRSSAQCPDVIELRQMALVFHTALTGGDAAKLRLWIEGARRCEYGPVVRFAYGLRKDLLAVSAAVETSWSTGQAEGQINRLKMIKRRMYGRAGSRLLRARVLPHMPAICVGPAP
jgi:transposase